LKPPITAENTKSDKKTRIQLDLSPQAFMALTELKSKTEATTNAEVIRNALKLYNGLITETELGSTFLVRNKDGVVSPYKIFL